MPAQTYERKTVRFEALLCQSDLISPLFVIDFLKVRHINSAPRASETMIKSSPRSPEAFRGQQKASEWSWVSEGQLKMPES